MPSLDFDAEKGLFREFYESGQKSLIGATGSFVTLVTSLLAANPDVSVSKIEGRLKEKEECISKFTRKYRKDLEANETPYSIIDHITYLIGLRVVCLYEDDVEKIKEIISEHFDVLEVTDKIAQIENTEGSFGYKGLHLDIRLSNVRTSLPEYKIYEHYKVELQIRTVIQDSWSILDHKIKYKKSIPTRLKRRINTLAALFELADREFREVRDSTNEEIVLADSSYTEIDAESESAAAEVPTTVNLSSGKFARLDAFSFLKIAGHFFHDFDFEPHKVDGFAKEIVDLEPSLSRGKFNYYMRENIANVKKYQRYFESNHEGDFMNPYTVIRHCLFAGDPIAFAKILTRASREAFLKWQEEQMSQAPVAGA